MRTRIVVGKGGSKMGTRLPRNMVDWKIDFSSHYSVQDRGFESECWIWGNISNEKVYGQTRLNKKPIPAHRLSWMLWVGKIPDGIWVLHKCDVRHCVNPDHLFLGTAQDNTNDMRSKNRHRVLNANPATSILTVERVIQIREMLCDTECKIEDIAKKFKVSFGAIAAISEGITWKHIGPIIWSRRKTLKVSYEDVLKIKSLLIAGQTQASIAARFGITQSQVSRIKSGERNK